MASFFLKPILRQNPKLVLTPYTPHPLHPHKYFTHPTRSQSYSTSTKPPSPSLPLTGTTVLSLEQAIAAPYCTRHLADHGARVLKIERPDTGDFARAYDTRVRGLSSHFVWCNRGKESVVLDLKQAADLQVLKQLLKSADVFVQNLAPGACARMGLSYEALSKLNPGIIVCDISGYGSSGPYAHKKAYDLLIQAESGLLSVTGTPNGEKVKAGISIADIAAGMYAYSNILTALIHRNQTGKGKHIDISMLESMVEWMGFPLYYAYDGAQPPRPQGASHASIYPYGTFEVGDGSSVLLGIQNEREWVTLCASVLDNAALAHDERFRTSAARSENRDALHEIIVARFTGLTAVQVIQKLDQAGIANAKVNEMAGVWAHPQLEARRRWMEVDSAVGPVKALVPPGLSLNDSINDNDDSNDSTDKNSNRNSETAPRGAIPQIGEHTDQILNRVKGTA